MDNKAHNAQVEAYLKDYLNDEGFAQFAVLLTGIWGSGKTHFILKLKDQYEARTPHEKNITKTEINWVYVSLNGIDSIDEIEKRIFMAAHAWLNNTAIKLGKSFLGSIVASPQICGVGFNTKNFMQDLKKLLPKVKNAAFIFDDVERCRLSLSNLFGYINNFVEHDKLKVIIVTDEDKLKEYYDKEKHSQQNDRSFSTYEQVKEKLIGQTLEVKPDIESAVEAFTNNINDDRTKGIIRKNKDTIIEIFINSQTNNFRSLKKAFFSFQRLQRFIDRMDRGKETDVEIIDAQLGDLLLRVIILTLEYLAGNIAHPSNINFEKFKGVQAKPEFSQNMSKNFKPSMLENSENKNLNSQNIQFIYWSYFRTRYFMHGLFRTPIPYNKLGTYIETGSLPYEDDISGALRDDYLNREFWKQAAQKTDEEQERENEESGNYWLNLANWHIIAPNMLEERISKLMKALMRFKVVEMSDIVQTTGILQQLIKYGYNPLPDQLPLDVFITRYMDDLTSAEIPAYFEQLPDSEVDLDWYGFEPQLQPDDDLYKIIKKKTIDRVFSQIHDQEDLLSHFSFFPVYQELFGAFFRDKYITFPMMNYLDPNIFATTIEISETPNFDSINALKKRYQVAPHLKAEEQEWLEKLKQAVYLQIDALPAPYKSQRRELFDEIFEGFDG